MGQAERPYAAVVRSRVRERLGLSWREFVDAAR